MDPSRFDALSKALASRRSRRRLGAGGLAAGLLAALGGEHASAATSDCSLSIVAKTAAGPHKGTNYTGTLTLQIGEQGAIDQGSFATDDGKSHPLVGQATGRALNLRITLAAGQVLALDGTADLDLLLCRGEISGTFGGPGDTDIGAWRTVERQASGNGTSNAGTAANAAGNAGGSASGSGNAGGSASGGNAGGNGNAAPTGGAATTTTTTTTTTTKPPGCPACQTLSGGACAPVADGAACGSGSVCCKGQCVDTRQFEGDNANCGACGVACPAGQFCSNGACGVCAQLGDRCNANTDCCSNFCNQGGCDQLTCPAGQVLCQNQCVDTRQFDADNANCGACGNACPAGQFCSNGACGSCAQLGDRCNGNGDCCSGFCNQGGCDQL